MTLLIGIQICYAWLRTPGSNTFHVVHIEHKEGDTIQFASLGVLLTGDVAVTISGVHFAQVDSPGLHVCRFDKKIFCLFSVKTFFNSCEANACVGFIFFQEPNKQTNNKKNT